MLRSEDNVFGNFKLGAFATGDYYCTCSTCGCEFEGDKRAMVCFDCAVKSANEAIYNDRERRFKEFLDLGSDGTVWTCD